ncbi:MAG TPA: hypothetical protein VFI82_07450 [Terriglobales bacterium]|nr:hypothetical protein [Terriglobales bacterium]
MRAAHHHDFHAPPAWTNMNLFSLVFALVLAVMFLLLLLVYFGALERNKPQALPPEPAHAAMQPIR